MIKELILTGTRHQKTKIWQIHEAEKNGITSQCDVYDKDCPKSILDFVVHIVNL